MCKQSVNIDEQIDKIPCTILSDSILKTTKFEFSLYRKQMQSIYLYIYELIPHNKKEKQKHLTETFKHTGYLKN